jgi:hypothetical protein
VHAQQPANSNMTIVGLRMITVLVQPYQYGIIATPYHVKQPSRQQTFHLFIFTFILPLTGTGTYVQLRKDKPEKID